MSNYYDYREVKVMIAHRLMAMDGWKVFGYSPDQSDSMTDFYCPAHWEGVAEKNGYILCVDVYGAKGPEEIREYNYSDFSYSRDISEKIKKLESMTIERGASEEEERSAKEKILKLQQKAEQETENRSKYIVTGIIPGHMEHPSRCNWHIEKDGIIIVKGNGILKYSSIYYDIDRNYAKEYQKDKNAYIKNYIEDLLLRGCYDTEEKARKSAMSHVNDVEEKISLINNFNKFINKIDTTCGGLLGEGDGTVYEKVIVTEYKTELKVVETSTGSIAEGQLFKLKINFNYGHDKGQVFRIHETEYNGKKHYHAYKLNGKRTKECTGQANSSNQWSCFNEKFLKWIEEGAIAWCELKEVKTPYEVEKVVKKTVKESTKTEKEVTEETDISNLTFEVSEDTDTRTNDKIFLVRVAEKLSREEYLQVNKYIKSLGGYYSKFKHAFLFKENPTTLLDRSKLAESPEEKQETTTGTEPQQKQKSDFNYIITEDTHTKTGATIWLVNFDTELSKTDFAEVKQKFARLQGYYSSFKKAFIFKYDPTEKIKTA